MSRPIPLAPAQWRRAPDGSAWYVAALHGERALLLASDARDARGAWVAMGGRNASVAAVATWPLCARPARTEA